MVSFAALLRSLMGERGLKAADLARLVPCDKAYISRLVNGRQHPSRQIARRLDELAGADGLLVAAAAGAAAAGPALSAVAAERWHRREALGVAGGDAGVVTGPAGEWGRLAAAVRRPSAVSAGVVEELEQITARQRILYHELSSAELLGPAEAHLRLLAALLRGTQPDHLRHRVASAAVETAGLAAWLWFDAGDRVKMAALYGMAGDLLAEAGNPALGAYVTGYRALIADASGRGREASRHAQTAWDLAPAMTSRLARSWLAAVGASTLALTGDRLRAADSLRQARDHLDAADGGEEWMFDFDRSALASYQGQCHLRLGQVREAAAAFREGLAAVPAGCGRRGAFLAIGLAEASLAAREVEAAKHQALGALAVFEKLGSAAGVLRVHGFRGLLAEAGHQREAEELDQHVRGYPPAAP